MTSHFAAHSVPVGRLLAAPFLIETPAYQRAYVWSQAEASRLLEDLTVAAEAFASRDTDEVADFLGAILLVDRSEAMSRVPGWPFTGEARAFEVVDGLQRLTTLSILLCVLRDAAEAAGEAVDPSVASAIADGAIPRLRLRSGDETFFDTYVRSPRRLRPDVQACSSPAEERIAAVQDLFQATLAPMDGGQRARLANFLIAHCYVVVITTTGIDRAHRMFMVLNERGKPLARNDILKADTLGRAGADAPAVTEMWHDIEKRLGHDFETFFSHLRAIYGKPTGPIISSIRSIADHAGGAQTFVAQILKPAAEAFDAIRQARAERWPQADEVEQLLRYMHWLPAIDWVPPALQYWLSSAQRSGDMLGFLRGLDRLAHGMKIMGTGAGKRASRFAAVTAMIRRGEDPLQPGSPLALSGTEERTIRYHLRDIHARAPVIAKILLLRINDRMAGAPQHVSPDLYTVEHVLPRKHNATSQWRRWFEEPALRSECTESLGNLLLVTKAQNDKAGNQEFANKLGIYFQANAPVPPINESLRGLKAWTPEAVLAREQDLQAHLDAIFGFGLANSKQDVNEAELAGQRTRRQA